MSEYKLFPYLKITEDLFKKKINERINLGRKLSKIRNINDSDENVYLFDEWDRYNSQLIKQSVFQSYNDCFDHYFKAGYPSNIDGHEVVGFHLDELIEQKLAALDFIGRNSSSNGIGGRERRYYTEEILIHKIDRVLKEVFHEVLVVDFSNRERYRNDSTLDKTFKFLNKGKLHGILYHPLEDIEIMDCLHLRKLYKSELIARPNYALVIFPSDEQKLRELEESKSEILAKTLGILIGKFSEYYNSNISVIGYDNLTRHKCFELESQHNHEWLKENESCQYCEKDYELIRELALAGYMMDVGNLLNDMKL